MIESTKHLYRIGSVLILLFSVYFENIEGLRRVNRFSPDSWIAHNHGRSHFLKLDSDSYDGDKDFDALDALSYIESLSPSKKASQRVGCILQSKCDSSSSIVIAASNTFLNNVGVHAEMNAISQYINLVPIPVANITMTVTFSPCVECAILISFLTEIKEVRYVSNYGDGGIDILHKADIAVGEVQRRNGSKSIEKNLKLHSYSKVGWTPQITFIALSLCVSRSREDPSSSSSSPSGPKEYTVITHTALTPFDIRPYIIRGLRERVDSSDTFSLSYVGLLNHREKLFLDVLAIPFHSVSLP